MAVREPNGMRTSRLVCWVMALCLASATIASSCMGLFNVVSIRILQIDISWIWLFNFFTALDVMCYVAWLMSLGGAGNGDTRIPDPEQLRKEKQRGRRLHDKTFKAVVTLVCLAITVNLGRLMPEDVDKVSFKDGLVGSLFYLSVLLNGGWFFYLLAPLVRRRILNASLFMVLFVWGCALYYFLPVDDNRDTEKIERQIEAPNRTVAAFFPSRGGFETVAQGGGTASSKGEQGKGNTGARRNRMHYFVFHTFVLFYVALITFAIFGRGIVNRVRKWLIPWKRLNVFWGRSEAGLLLARSIITTTERDQVYFMLQQKSGDGDEWRTLTRDIDEMDGMWSFTYDSNAVETDVSKDTLVQAKGRRHFFMDESAHVNVSRADRIVKLLKDNPPSRGIGGFWKALCAGMIVQWWKSCYLRTLWECVAWWKKEKEKGFRDWWEYCWTQWGSLDLKWEKPFLYVRIEAPADELTYQTWAANVRDWVTPVLIRESQLIAKDFIRTYPLLKMPEVFNKIDTDTALAKVEDEIKILIIGFGATGQDVLNEIICNGRFVKSYDDEGNAVPIPLHVDVVEQDEKVIEEYCIRRPLATRHPEFSAVEYGDKRYDVNFVERSCLDDDGRLSAVECGEKRYEVKLDSESVRVEDKTFDDWFRGRLDEGGKKCPYNRIIVCLKGDDKTLGIAGKIVEFTRRHCSEIAPDVVFARVKDPSRNRYLPQGRVRSIFSKNKKGSPEKGKKDLGITLFGNLDDIYSFGRIDVEVVDAMAKVLNSRYNKDGNSFCRDLADVGKREDDWEQASFFDQLSSRAAAEGLRNMLLLRGMDYRENVKVASKTVSPKEVDSPLTDESFYEKDSVLKTLSVNEHLRWNAFHVMLGYRPWNILGRKDDARDDIPKPWPDKIDANQLGVIGKHAYIVEFEKLPDVAMQVAEWKNGKAQPTLVRTDFEGLKDKSPQAWDIAFCQIVGKVADEVGLEIVELRPFPPKT